MGEMIAAQPAKPKKKSGCLKKTFFILIALFAVAFVSERIRYAADSDYAQQQDARKALEETERKAQEERKAEEKKLADARKAEEDRIAAAKREEERAAKEAEDAARAESRRLEDEFFARAVEARKAAEERVKSGTSLRKTYDFPGILNIDYNNEREHEVLRLYLAACEEIQDHIRNDGDPLINFKGGEKSRKGRHAVVRRAIESLERAAEFEDVSAPAKAQVLWLLGRCYFEYDDGADFEKHKETGTGHLLRAANLGSLSAATYGSAHGRPAAKKDEFQKHLKSAADNGYLPAQSQYLFSNFTSYKEAPEAWEFVLDAAGNDSPQAQFVMTLLYGSAKNQDPPLPKKTLDSFEEESGKWLRLAAENGDAFARTAMEKFSLVSTDAEKEKWLRLAAEQDYPEAQYRLGVLLGTQRKEEEAVRWLFVASRNDSAGARSLLKEIMPQMTKEARDLIRKQFGESHYLLDRDNPFHVYDVQEVNHNLSILYLRNLDNNRVSLLMIAPPFGDGGEYYEAVSVGTGGDPRWKVVYENSDFENLNVVLESGSRQLRVVYVYQRKIPYIELFK